MHKSLNFIWFFFLLILREEDQLDMAPFLKDNSRLGSLLTKKILWKYFFLKSNLFSRLSNRSKKRFRWNCFISTESNTQFLYWWTRAWTSLIRQFLFIIIFFIFFILKSTHDFFLNKISFVFILFQIINPKNMNPILENLI